MKLRTKLTVAQAPIIAALALVAGAALHTAVRLGRAPGAILYENFRSFDAGRGMLTALDDIDRTVVARCFGHVREGDPIIENGMSDFERELALQITNITEAGEDEAPTRSTGSCTRTSRRRRSYSS